MDLRTGPETTARYWNKLHARLLSVSLILIKGGGRCDQIERRSLDILKNVRRWTLYMLAFSSVCHASDASNSAGADRPSDVRFGLAKSVESLEPRLTPQFVLSSDSLVIPVLGFWTLKWSVKIDWLIDSRKASPPPLILLVRSQIGPTVPIYFGLRFTVKWWDLTRGFVSISCRTKTKAGINYSKLSHLLNIH